MPLQLIDGRQLAENIKDNIAENIYSLGGSRPNLAIILVGQRPDSQLYVKLKQQEAKKVGIDTHFYGCPENISQAELLETIRFLNNDPLIDGILLQLPLPQHLDADEAVNAINPDKDVDGFTAENLNRLQNNQPQAIIPPVFGVVLKLIAEQELDLTGQLAIILGNSTIFGYHLADLIKQQGAEVEVYHRLDKNVQARLNQAKLIISALGRPLAVKIKQPQNNYLIIDIGITKRAKKVYGDVDLKSINPLINGWATPVPGGVGPLTIAMALNNTFLLYQQHHG
jgi:methylenetetrahydrofolate dehydrogenase (NADP+)/methenyltetrahydrofolate cyclohydrolase